MTRRFWRENWALMLGVLLVFIGLGFPPSGSCGGVGIHGAEPGKWWISGFYVIAVQYKYTTRGGLMTCTIGTGWLVLVPLGVALVVYGFRRNRKRRVNTANG